MASLLLFWAAHPYVCQLCPACVRPKASPGSRREGLVRPGAACLLETSSADGVPGGRCCLDADQMALGADELLAGALQPWELPLPSPAFLAVGSCGRGINLLLALPYLGVAEAPACPVSEAPCIAQPVSQRGAGGRLEVLPQTCCPLCGVPHICLAVSWGGFSLFWE